MGIPVADRSNNRPESSTTRHSATLERVNSKNLEQKQPKPQAQPRLSGFSLNRQQGDQAQPQGMDLKRQSGMVGVTVAGEANRPGGVYDRLSSTKTFTGVYAKRFEGGLEGGRINGDTINSRSHGYKGDTNANTDQRIDDISQILRR